MKSVLSGLIAVLALIAGTVEAAERWQALRGGEARLLWQAPGLEARAEKAEGMQGQLGYRIERYLWKAQEAGGAFALAALRDFSDSDHYISGKLDAAKTAQLLLKGLEMPPVRLLDESDISLPTGLGTGMARRFAVGMRECLGVVLYAGPEALNGEKPKPMATPLSEGSMRLDALYCAKAGGKLLLDDLPGFGKGLSVLPQSAQAAQRDAGKE